MELTNFQGPFAVAVITYGRVLGYVPRTISRTVSFFLREDRSIGFRKVTGVMVNCATSQVWPENEISFVYRFYGHQAYIERLKNLFL